MNVKSVTPIFTWRKERTKYMTQKNSISTQVKVWGEKEEEE